MKLLGIGVGKPRDVFIHLTEMMAGNCVFTHAKSPDGEEAVVIFDSMQEGMVPLGAALVVRDMMQHIIDTATEQLKTEGSA